MVDEAAAEAALVELAAGSLLRSRVTSPWLVDGAPPAALPVGSSLTRAAGSGGATPGNSGGVRSPSFMQMVDDSE